MKQTVVRCAGRPAIGRWANNGRAYAWHERERLRSEARAHSPNPPRFPLLSRDGPLAALPEDKRRDGADRTRPVLPGNGRGGPGLRAWQERLDRAAFDTLLTSRTRRIQGPASWRDLETAFAKSFPGCQVHEREPGRQPDRSSAGGQAQLRLETTLIAAPPEPGSNGLARSPRGRGQGPNHAVADARASSARRQGLAHQRRILPVRHECWPSAT